MVIKRCCIYSNTQGVRNLKETDLNPMYVLIKPPSMEVLEKRLRDRKTETKESLQKRLDVAREELTYGKRTNYIYLVCIAECLLCEASNVCP